MREILFRGKRVDNVKWLQGNLLYYPDVNRAFISAGDYFKGDCHEVSRKTVGQFTGLTDKNEKRIFEGDIVKDDWDRTYEVLYTTTSCSFMVKCSNPPNEWEKGNYRIGKDYCKTIQIIGNIHDNPELLKGE